MNDFRILMDIYTGNFMAYYHLWEKYFSLMKEYDTKQKFQIFRSW